MKAKDFNLSTKKLAKWIGLFYPIILFCGLCSGTMVREAIIDTLDASGTLQRLIENESLFRARFLSDRMMVIAAKIVLDNKFI